MRATKNAQGWDTVFAVNHLGPFVLNESGATGVCYDEQGKPMLGSTMVRDPESQDRTVAETRALLSAVSA
jgi:hypothetical protein